MLAAIAALLLSDTAWGACRMVQYPTPDGVRLAIDADSEPLSCRTVTLRSAGSAPVVRRAALDGRRVRKDHVVPVEGGVAVGFPEMRPGDHAEVVVTTADAAMEVILGVAPPLAPRAAETHTTWTVTLDPKHPGWGFADATLATTAVVELTVGPDGRREFTRAGAPAQGVLELPPGSFTLAIPGARLSGVASPGVVIHSDLQSLRFDAPHGGTARWRVSSVAGEPVIPDLATFVAGIDWRFGLASFPEPAPPTSFRATTDPAADAIALYDAVSGMVVASLPGADPQRPRPLNRAWRDHWGSSVEIALVLDRLLAQQRLTTAWVLTGTSPDPLTLTGYDRGLVALHLGDEDYLLDPACASCDFGEVSTRLAGRPAIGGVEFVPVQEGRLERTIRLTGTEFAVEVRAEGAAALWLRELAEGVSAALVAERIPEALGLPGGRLLKIEGLDEPGEEVRVQLATSSSVKPAPEAGLPWVGPWIDG